MKRYFCVLLAVTLLFCVLTGCGQKMPLENIGDNTLSDAAADSAEQEIVRVMQYNVKNCGNGKNIQEIASDIQRETPQIVCLQELDWSARRSDGKEILKQLAEILSMNYVFVPAMQFEGGLYGIGILSVYPIENSTRILLPVQDGEEARVLAKAQIQINGKALEIFNTHLGFESMESRQNQFSVLRENIEMSECFVLCGDFNVEGYSEFDALGQVHAVNNTASNYQTYLPENEASGMFLGLDNIVIAKDMQMQNSRMVNTKVSDHNMLVTDIIL